MGTFEIECNGVGYMEEKAEYNRKIKLYEKLGALKFQKVVFAVERAKFKIIKKFCPNFLKHFDKYCDMKKKRELKRAKNTTEVEKINRKYKNAKMAMRKEFHQEKNRNYHLNENNPKETYEYLEWNKSVHKRNLKLNLVAIPVLIAGLFFFPAISAPLLAFELFKAGINFECINIQNYNICRYKRAEEALLKHAQKKTERRIEEYGEASKVISQSIEKSSDLPSIDDIIGSIENKEQLRQMKKLLEEAQRERKIDNNRGKTK